MTYEELCQRARELGCVSVEPNYLPAEHLERRIAEAEADA